MVSQAALGRPGSFSSAVAQGMSSTAVSIFMIAAVALFVAVDVVLFRDKYPGNTYSEIIRDTGNRHPWFRVLFLVAVGVLLGHFFW